MKRAMRAALALGLAVVGLGLAPLASRGAPAPQGVVRAAIEAEAAARAAGAVSVGTTSSGLDIKRTDDQDLAVAGSPDIRQTYVISNTTGTDMTLCLGQLRGPDEAIIGATWTSADSNRKLEGHVALPAKSRLVLTLSAKTAGSGRYTVAITARARGQGPQTYQFVVERRTRLPDSGVFVAKTNPAQVTTRAWPGATRLAKVEFDAKNTGPTPVDIHRPFIRSVARTVDGRSSQADLTVGRGFISCTPAGTETAELVRLPLGRSCAAAVFAEVSAPGSYVLTTTANGAGDDDGQANIDLALNVKAHLLWPVVIAVFGTVVGSWVTRWRTQGRARMLAQREIRTENDRVQNLQTLARRFGRDAPVEEVAARLQDLWDGVASDRIHTVAEELPPLRARLELVRQWVLVLDDIRRAPQAARQDLDTAADGVAAELEDLSRDNEEVEKSLETLEGQAQAVLRGQPGGPALLAARAAPAPSGISLSRLIPRLSTVRPAVRKIQRSARNIDSVLKRNDMLVDLLVGATVCAAAISTSWLPNATWGGVGDMLALLTATLGLQTGTMALARSQPVAS